VDDPTSVLFGLRDFEVLEVVETDDAVIVTVQTVNPVLLCPDCGHTAGRSRGRPTVTLRDVRVGVRPCRVRWAKHRRACANEACERRSFTEQHPAVGERRRTTARLRVEVARQAGRCARPITEVAAEHAVGWHLVMRSIHEDAQARRLGVEIPPVRHLGVDETTYRRRRRFVTNLADVEHGVEIDVIEGRSAGSFGAWLAARPQAWRAGVQVVAMDASGPFRSAVQQQLPHATIVLDRFHALRLFHNAIDDIRRRMAWQLHVRRGRKIDAAWRYRHFLLTGWDRLKPEHQDRLLRLFNGPEDPDGELAWAYLIKETARETWRSPSIGAWGNLLQLLADSPSGEHRRLGRTLDAWHDEIVASFTIRVTNAATEGLNRKVKQVKRAGCGYRNQHNYKIRVLQHCGPKP